MSEDVVDEVGDRWVFLARKEGRAFAQLDSVMYCGWTEVERFGCRGGGLLRLAMGDRLYSNNRRAISIPSICCCCICKR